MQITYRSKPKELQGKSCKIRISNEQRIKTVINYFKQRGYLFLLKIDVIPIQYSNQQYKKLQQKKSIMSRKQSHEQKSSHYQISSNYSNSNVRSPYIQLLESKKKVYGHRFDGTKQNRSYGSQFQLPNQPNSTKNQLRASVGSSKTIQNSNNQNSKHFKSVSSEKYGYNYHLNTNQMSHPSEARNSNTNEKVKRVRTQQAESTSKRPSSSNPYYHQMKSNKKQSKSIKQKMHESLNVHPNSSNQTYESADFDHQYHENMHEYEDKNNEDIEKLQFSNEKYKKSTSYYKQYLDELINGNKPFNAKNVQKQKDNYLGTSDKNKNIAQKSGKYDYLRQYPDQKNMTKNITEYHNMSFQQSGKNRRKRHLSENKQRYQDNSHQNLHLSGQNFNNNQLYLSKIGLENLQINDIDSLIQLIDNCVHEANQYIGYLSQKLQEIKQELILSRSSNSEYQQKLKKTQSKLLICNQYIGKLEKNVEEKNREIENLQKQLQEKGSDAKQPNMEIRNLLQIIEKINTENERLRSENTNLTQNISFAEQERESEPKAVKKDSKNKDYYHEINGRIDILNISIENKRSSNCFDEDMSNSKNKDFRELQKDDLKKLKFIKPKYK